MGLCNSCARDLSWPTQFKIVPEDTELEGSWRPAKVDEVKPFEARLKAHLKSDARVDFTGGRLNGSDHDEGKTMWAEDPNELPEEDEENPVKDILIIEYVEEELKEGEEAKEE